MEITELLSTLIDTTIFYFWFNNLYGVIFQVKINLAFSYSILFFSSFLYTFLKIGFKAKYLLDKHMVNWSWIQSLQIIFYFIRIVEILNVSH